jgi:hypothetical protein
MKIITKWWLMTNIMTASVEIKTRKTNLAVMNHNLSTSVQHIIQSHGRSLSFFLLVDDHEAVE